MSGRHWQGLSLLDVLRPELGMRASCAVLTSYSVDLVALVASLLALGGLDDDRGSGSKVDLAQAVEQLRGRFRVIAQSGRVQAPAKSPKILALMDQFLREVQSDEQVGSWHPKLALVRYEPVAVDAALVSPANNWRFWISSRNLTRDMSWDAGLLLTGKAEGSGKVLPGIRSAAEILLERAQLELPYPALLRELETLRWLAPDGMDVEDFELMLPESGGRGLPEPPRDIHDVMVVSPFLDPQTVEALGAWGTEGTRRRLLSIGEQLQMVATRKPRALDGFEILGALDAPETGAELCGAQEAEASQEIIEDTSEQELEGQGLHAKLILVRHGAGQTLWLGSANATARGWKGPNYEAVARLRVPLSVFQGLETLMDMGRPFKVESGMAPVEEPETRRELERARNQVANRWQVIHRVEAGGSKLATTVPPHPDHAAIDLSVGLLGHPLMKWERSQLELSIGSFPVSELTELVRIRLAYGEDQMEWLQRAPLDPPPSVERDRQAIARHLDARIFLLWIRSLLEQGEVFEGGGDWWNEAPDRAKGRGGRQRAVGWAPTLEDVLRTWTRSPETLIDADNKIRHYLKIMNEMDPSHRSVEERETLAEFWKVWQILAAEFIPARESAS